MYTGDRWNACTDANVSLKLIGHRGDSGTRKLLASDMVHMFRKGKVGIVLSLFRTRVIVPFIGKIYKNIRQYKKNINSVGWDAPFGMYIMQHNNEHIGRNRNQMEYR